MLPQPFSDIPSACQMNTRQHCNKWLPTGNGGRSMPGSTTERSRIGSAVLPPNAGFHTPRKSCSILPGATMPEPIVSVADLLPDDRRVARMGLVGDGRAAGIHNDAADHQALAPNALSPCRSRAAARRASAAVMPGAPIPVGSCRGSLLASERTARADSDRRLWCWSGAA